MIGSFHELVEQQRSAISANPQRGASSRRTILRTLKSAIQAHERELYDALTSDLGKSSIEAFTSELGYVLTDIDHALKYLDSWMKPVRHGTPLGLWPAKSHVICEPLGVVLVIGPWNYPLQLLVSPAVAALTAGNNVILKPSELAPATAATVATMIRSSFDPAVLSVVEGGILETTELLQERFDHIFFTGSSRVGRIVMAAAAKRLTPVTLELGGKSPCIVDDRVDMSLTTRRIVWGKTMNAGQTCVAPDHVFVPAASVDAFIESAKKTIVTFFGEEPRKSGDYARIVSANHVERLAGYLGDGSTVVLGGDFDVEARYFGPTLLLNPRRDSPVMEEEIFGPILPIIPYTNIDEVIESVKSRPKPLACYIFGEDRAFQNRLISSISCGGICINDTISHIISKKLPFGGVGESGFGRYHGRAGFETFSNQKSIMLRSLKFDLTARYPPYSISLGFLKKIYRWLYQ